MPPMHRQEKKHFQACPDRRCAVEHGTAREPRCLWQLIRRITHTHSIEQLRAQAQARRLPLVVQRRLDAGVQLGSPVITRARARSAHAGCKVSPTADRSSHRCCCGGTPSRSEGSSLAGPLRRTCTQRPKCAGARGPAQLAARRLRCPPGRHHTASLRAARAGARKRSRSATSCHRAMAPRRAHRPLCR